MSSATALRVPSRGWSAMPQRRIACGGDEALRKGCAQPAG
jgi:hypothetical protein